MPRPISLLCLPLLTVSLCLSPHADAEPSPSTSKTTQKRASGVEKLEGIWKIEALGGKSSGVDFVRFGASNSAQWFHFESKDSCWTTRHQYRLVRDRILFTPNLPDGRSWWQPNFETPARIELLERRKTEEGRTSQRVRLVRSSLYNADCELRELE